jgi:immune inhibitor A
MFVAVAGLAAPAAARPVPTRGDLDLLVVLASFPDRALARPQSDLWGAPTALVDRLVAYFAEVSAGRLRIVPHLGGPAVTLPLPRARYVQQPARLARDAIEAFFAATDPGERAARAEAAAVLVVFAGTGRESHADRPEPADPWSNYVALAPPAEGFSQAIVLAEAEEPPFSNFGVLCHEFGHLLGLPELYATGGRPHEGIGVWGLLGQGTWLGRGDRPPHPEAWSKLRLGWVDAETVTQTTRGVRLPAVEREPRVLKIPAAPGNPGEYYLLENRQRIGADASLPGEGVLVWHVDEAVSGYRTAQNDPAHKLLHLVEADGRGDLDRGHAAGGNRGDGGDPWAGPGWARRTGGTLLLVLGIALLGAGIRGRGTARTPHLRGRWRVALGLAGLPAAGAGLWLLRGPTCGPATPGMAPYDGGPARVTVRGFSASGPEMTVDVEVAPLPPGPSAPAAERDWQPVAPRG